MKLLLFPFTLIFLFWVNPQINNDWQQKVAPSVLKEAAAGSAVEFLVLLSQQAKVQQAELFRNKEDKGTYVYEQLSQLAAKTQNEVISVLKNYRADYRSFWVINAVWAKGDIELLEALATLPEVREIQSNPKVRFPGPVEDTQNKARSNPAIEWGVSKINADDVWTMGFKGEGVVVGGQDTGVKWDHQAIVSQYRGSRPNGTINHNYNWHDAIHNAGSGNPCGSDSTVPCDDHGHGTHTIGTMDGDDGALNQIGVAPAAKWIACRNMDRGNGTPASYIECFQWFIAPTNLNNTNPLPARAPDVINNSWSCPTSEGCNSGNWATMQAVVANVRASGIVVVASAGNSGSGCGTVNTPPAMFAESYSVGATNSSDGIAGFSSRGPVTVDGSNRPKPDVSAPGVGVRSCTIDNMYNDIYVSWSGTSMAGPHVAGAVALLLSADPGLSGNVNLIEALLRDNATGLTSTQNCGGVPGSQVPNNTFGYGRIDVLAAVNSALALPVELVTFRAAALDKAIQLTWETASELNNDHFEIERSGDLAHWQNIGQVAAHGAGSYSFEDRQPLKGTNYYRLRQVDRDGSFEHSKVVSAKLESQLPDLVPYPNPFHDQLVIPLPESGYGPGRLRIFDVVGRSIFEAETEQQAALVVPTVHWPSGVYFILLEQNDTAIRVIKEILKL